GYDSGGHRVVASQERRHEERKVVVRIPNDQCNNPAPDVIEGFGNQARRIRPVSSDSGFTNFLSDFVHIRNISAIHICFPPYSFSSCSQASHVSSPSVMSAQYGESPLKQTP